MMVGQGAEGGIFVVKVKNQQNCAFLGPILVQKRLGMHPISIRVDQGTFGSLANVAGQYWHIAIVL